MHFRFSLFVFAGLLTLGCGHRVDYNSTKGRMKAPLVMPSLVGSYSGTWSADNDDTGTITFNIDEKGNVTGEEREDGDKPVGKITGTVAANGELNAICHYEGYRPDPVTGQFGTNSSGEIIARVHFHHKREVVEQVYFLTKKQSSLAHTGTGK